MKRFILLAATLMSLGLAASAQEDLTDRWLFVGTGVGMNVGMDGQQFYDRENSHVGAGLAIDSYVGYMFSNWGGVRAGFHGLSISNKFTDFGCKRYEYLHADMLIRTRVKSVLPYIHLGLGHIDNYAFGGGAGVIFPIYVAKRVAIVPDIKATLFDNRIYNGSKNIPAITLSATLGVSVNLWKNPNKKLKSLEEEVKLQSESLKAMDEALKAQEEATRQALERPSIVRDTVIVTRIQHDTVMVDANGKAHQIITTMHADPLFETTSDVLNPDYYPQLDAVVTWMKEHPDVGIIVEGHTDNTGGKEFNMNLSLRRAQSVKAYLVRHGIRPSLITIEGYGFSRPVAENSTPEGRQQNRRVEVRVR